MIKVLPVRSAVLVLVCSFGALVFGAGCAGLTPEADTAAGARAENHALDRVDHAGPRR